MASADATARSAASRSASWLLKRDPPGAEADGSGETPPRRTRRGAGLFATMDRGGREASIEPIGCLSDASAGRCSCGVSAIVVMRRSRSPGDGATRSSELVRDGRHADERSRIFVGLLARRE